MNLVLALALYAIAMVAANLSVAAIGPSWELMAFNAVTLIGLDLALRDWLHYRLSKLQMFGLIVGAGLVSYALNPLAQRVCITSSVSFGMSAIVDWMVFLNVRGSWAKRSMASNVAGALVDSVAFPTIAFGEVLPVVVGSQLLCKIVGACVWTIVLSRFRPSGERSLERLDVTAELVPQR